ncbi:MAG TPA: hypothetical protein VH396_23370 [Chitinophagaceae bacterium]|jgi:hypothetical protein
MKNLSLLLIVGCLVGIISCKKETVTTLQNDQVAAAASMASVSSDQLVSNGTDFGVGGFGGLSTDQKIVLYNKLGVQYVRSQVTLKNFNGNIPGAKQLTDKGFKVVLNLNWNDVPTRKGDKQATPWPQDMQAYRQKLENVFSKYKPEVAVIENEPAVDIFHSGPVEDYITELTNAVQVCKKYNVKVADGSIHVPYVQEIMRGGKLSKNATEVKKLIAAYKTLDLDYVNVHAHGVGNSYASESLAQVANFLRQQTGKPVMSNEFSLSKPSASLLKDMVTGFKLGDYKIALVRSADTDRGTELNKGTNLLPLGISYRDMIK